MGAKILGLLRFAYENFAPLVVFLVAKQILGLKPAIAAAVGLGIADLVVRLVRRKAVSRLYLFTFAVTIVFGAIDLYAATPFVFAYEASVTNLLTAGFFGITLFRGTPLIQEIAEKTLSPEDAARPPVRPYLRLLTWTWTVYFVLKAGLYAYVGYAYDIDRAVAIRSAVGAVSLLALLFGERLVRRPLMAWLQRRGVLPPWSEPMPTQA